MSELIRKVLLTALILASCSTLEAQTLEELRILMHQGQASLAVDALKKQVSENPGNLEARCLLAQAYSWSHQFDAADTEYEKVLMEDPRYREAILGRARLRGYQGRPAEGITVANAGLVFYPDDREIIDLRNNLVTQSRGQTCDKKYRHAIRASYEKESYSFTDNGHSFQLSYADKNFHGWDSQIGLNRVERFSLTDSEASLDASHRVPWRGSTLGFAGSISNHHTLLPHYMLSVYHGMPLTARSEYEARLTYRRYEAANIFSLSPLVYCEFPFIGLTAHTTFSKTNYDSGQVSPVLISYGLRVQLTRLCPFKPWFSYARTKEAFEAGNAPLVKSFSANNYAVGTVFRVASQYELNLSYALEERSKLQQQVKRWNLGVNYFWGDE